MSDDESPEEGDLAEVFGLEDAGDAAPSGRAPVAVDDADEPLVQLECSDADEAARRAVIHIRRKLPGRRLDKYLMARFPRVSRTTLQKLIKQGDITLNGKPTKKILLAPGDRVQMGLLILELEDAPGGKTPATGRSGRSSMTEPIMEALSKVEREHEEEQRRHRAEREEKQRQREILASPEAPAPSARSTWAACSR